MKRFLLEKLPDEKHPKVTLSSDEAHHATHVLRLKSGDLVIGLDGSGRSMLCELEVDREHIDLKVPSDHSLSSSESIRPLEKEIMPFTLEIGIPKSNAMKLIIEKCVELGVQSIQPIFTDRSVINPESKSKASFQQRWQKIADQALKQCERLHRLEVQQPLTFSEWTENAKKQKTTRLWAYELLEANDKSRIESYIQNHTPPDTLSFVIGPEGGWSDDEQKTLETLATPICLSTLVLRCETAVFLAVCFAKFWYFR